MTQATIGRGYVGGGHIAAICGESPFMTRFMAWQEIVGQAPPPDAEKLKFFARRKRVEPLIFENLEIDHGIAIVKRNERYTHPTKPHFRAEIDAETADPVTIEAKSVHHFAAQNWGKDLNDDASVPSHVIMQTNWGMGIHPAQPQLAYAVGQVGFDDCRPYMLRRDDELIGLAQEVADKFWIDHVLTGAPPPATCVDDLKLMHPRSTPKFITATPEIIDRMQRLVEIRAHLDELDAKKLDEEFAIKTFLGDYDTLVAPGGTVLSTWKSTKDSAVTDWAAIAKFLKASPVVIAKYTTPKSGVRRFLVKA